VPILGAHFYPDTPFCKQLVHATSVDADLPKQPQLCKSQGKFRFACWLCFWWLGVCDKAAKHLRSDVSKHALETTKAMTLDTSAKAAPSKEHEQSRSR